MEYSTYIPDKDCDGEYNRGPTIMQMAKERGYVELKNDYFGTDVYFYDKTTGIIYVSTPRVDKFDKHKPYFELCNDNYIRQFNKHIIDNAHCR
jgi:hypothetical protein